MWNYIYNTYLFETLHNLYLQATHMLWFRQKRITYHPINSEEPELTITPKNDKEINNNKEINNKKEIKNENKLESIPEDLELTNFYYLSLFRESATTWSIHGLWPQTNAHTYPTYCHKVTFDPDLLAPLLEKLEQYWYSQGHTLTLDEKFWKHEYEKHGSCVYTPMNELEYFQNTIQLYEKALELGLPNTYYNPETKKCLIPVNQKLEFIPPSI